MEKKLKHLEIIQNVINRMASNSFLLKGWAVTLIAGIFALANKDSDKSYFLIAYIPIIIFWGMDSYYLKLERQFRHLYDKVRTRNDEDIDFSMKISSFEGKKELNYTNCLFSVTELLFYLPLAALSTLIIIITMLI